MDVANVTPPRPPSHDIIGYLNFSTGKFDPRFFAAVAEAYGFVASTPSKGAGPASRSAAPQAASGSSARRTSSAATPQLPIWRRFANWLRHEIADLQSANPAFQAVDQALVVCAAAFDDVLPAYRQFHRDLLFHQTDDQLFRPFFLARVLSTVLELHVEGAAGEELTRTSVARLNDFIGHRPIAVLNNERKLEPYEHEWVAPIPVYLDGAGFAPDVYRPLLEQALSILRATDDDVKTSAWFDPELLAEWAIDPRAYDFDHPVNKRPNYHFGQWDPHHIDGRGRYRRFVLQEVTVEAIWRRTQETPDIPADELLFEAGAVLAGTVLMAAAVGGAGPETHDSGTTLATLLPRIIKCREEFYSRLLRRIPGPHGERLRAEAEALRQPFGGARQHLNQRLAKLRAAQLQHVHLAQLFAQMGYADAGRRQAQIVPVASARMLCEINGLITTIHQLIDQARLAQAAAAVPEAVELLHRAIECGALVDPWNILGFQAQFSLFPALENTVRDHRVDVLVHLVKRLFALLVRLVGEAAAAGEQTLELRLDGLLESLAQWWDRFASTEVSGVDPVSGRDAVESAKQIGDALGAWHAGGRDAGDIVFWRKHVADFTSPKTYALVVETLLEKRDYVAAMALLMQWLGRFDEIPLVEGEFSFHALSNRWLAEMKSAEPAKADEAAKTAETADPLDDARRATLVAKFFDYLEANADENWTVPHFELSGDGKRRKRRSDSDAGAEHAESDAEEELFGAAYEDVVYRDSTRDGNEGNTFSGDDEGANEYQLEAEARRIISRLALIETAARLWKTVAVDGDQAASFGRDRLANWYQQADANREGLLRLLDEINAHSIPAPRGTHASLVEYDRRRQIKEDLEARTIVTCVETIDAARLLLATFEGLPEACRLSDWAVRFIDIVRSLSRGDRVALMDSMPRLRAALLSQPILYVPLARGGKPQAIVDVQSVQSAACTLLQSLPRLGLLAEAYRLIAVIQLMEKHRPIGDGAVTEFDRMFQVGFEASVQALVDTVEAAAANAATEVDRGKEDATETGSAAASRVDVTSPAADLFDGLQTLTEGWLKRWNTHSRSLRLSSLEKATDKKRWEALVEFIKNYGRDLFTPKFLNLGNLRAVLHQRVDVYLKRLEEDDDADSKPRLLEDLDRVISRSDAVEWLTIVIETLVENYAEFKDYNSTTTQSDQGDLLYILLDFLKLRLAYERFAWNLRPVLMVHEMLVRRRQTETAELWRRALTDRTQDAADWHLAQLRDLSRKHGVRLPTIADRLNERFVRPLAVDRLRALVRPAIEELHADLPTTAFSLLEQELREFTDNPSGSGLDVPAWLVALEDEVRRVQASVDRRAALPPNLPERLPRITLSWDELMTQLRSWDTAG